MVAPCNNGLPEVVRPTCTVQHVLRGQKALVTGANFGIGLGVALALGRAGAGVVVNYVSGDETAQQVVEEIKQSGVRAYAHKADVSKEDQVQAKPRAGGGALSHPRQQHCPRRHPDADQHGSLEYARSV
jgi:hypothetical protein